MRGNRLHRHFEGFHKLVVIKRPRGVFFHALDAAGRDVGVFDGVGNDFAVADFDHAVGVGGDAGVVRYHNDGVPVSVQLVDDFHHVFAAGGVERAGGFVGEDDFAAVHQGAGDGHALLLAAGEFVGFVVFFALQTQIVQQFFGAFGTLFVRRAHIHGGQGDVVAGSQRAQEVVTLEDKAEAFAPQPRQFVGIHFRGFDAVDLIRTRCGGVEAAQDVHQRGFARAGLADDGDEIAFFDGKAHVFQNMNAVFAAAEIAVDVFTFD